MVPGGAWTPLAWEGGSPDLHPILLHKTNTHLIPWGSQSRKSKKKVSLAKVSRMAKQLNLSKPHRAIARWHGGELQRSVPRARQCLMGWALPLPPNHAPGSCSVLGAAAVGARGRTEEEGAGGGGGGDTGGGFKRNRLAQSFVQAVQKQHAKPAAN